jgi:hypothetical protein
VDYADIPLPFGEMHTENAAATDLVRAAVVAQLAKPAVAPSGVWLATKTMRLQLLTWAGIIGGSVTIFSNLRGLFTMADWARWVVTRWHEWAEAFWTATLSWIGIHLHPSLAPSFSFAAFLAMLVIGTILRMRVGRHGSGSPPRARGVAKALLLRVGLYGAWLTAATAFYAFVLTDLIPSDSSAGVLLLGALVVFVANLVVPFAILIWAIKEHLQCVILVALLGCFWLAINVLPLGVYKDLDAEVFGLAFFVSLVLLPAGAIIIATIAPLRAVNQRLLFLVVGALALVALNAVSVFGLQRVLDAPKASGSAAPVPGRASTV